MRRIWRETYIFRYLITTVVLLITVFVAQKFFKHEDSKDLGKGVPFLSVSSALADSILQKMSLEEKIARLIFYDPQPITKKNFDSILNIVLEIRPGALALSCDSIIRHVDFFNRLNIGMKIAPLKAFIADGETSGFVLEGAAFPRTDTWEAVSDDSVKNLWQDDQMRLFKQFSFDLLVLNEHDSLKTDSFAEILLNEDMYFVQKLQSQNILACLPANRRTRSDSTSEILTEKIKNSEVSGLFISHFTKKKKLKKKSNADYSGLYIAKCDKPTKDSVEMLFKNNVDLFLTQNPEIIISHLKYLLQSKKISETEIDFKLRKILMAKIWTENFERENLKSESCKALLISPLNEAHSRLMFKRSIVVLKKDAANFPPQNLKFKKIVLLTYGKSSFEILHKVLDKYFEISLFSLNKNNQTNTKIAAIPSATDYFLCTDTLISDSEIRNQILTLSSKNSFTYLRFGKIVLPDPLFDSAKTVILIPENNPQNMKNAADALMGGIPLSGRLFYDIDSDFICGKIITSPKTRLSHVIPEEVGADSKVLERIDSVALDAIGRGAMPGCQITGVKSGYIFYDKSFGKPSYDAARAVFPDDVYDIASVTKIAAATLETMLLYEKGALKLDDAIGKYYKNTKIDYLRIKPDTLIRLDTMRYAEVKDFSKILKKQDTLRINDSLFLAYDTLIARSTPKNNIFKVTFRELLMHQSGIAPALPILPYILYNKDYFDLLKKQKAYRRAGKNQLSLEDLIGLTASASSKYEVYYSRRKIKDSAEIEIAENMFFRQKYFDTLWTQTKELKVFSRKIYQYSDVNMILLQMTMDSLTKKSINNYVAENIYRPLGLRSIGYLPLKRINKNRIMPTEDDKYWRNQLLRGFVHDPSAALLGGVAGNAGIFSNSYDLAVLAQMWLNGGLYGGVRYLKSSTIDYFTKKQPDSGRGLGFDKPNKKQIIGNGASDATFGHTGFTGTCLWVDPRNELIFVFLSNRVHPKQKNGRINSLKVRQKIHTILYEACK